MEQPPLKRRHQTGDSALPEELLVEIFARLPAKSVRRFRCLSRTWPATLSSSSFTDLHLERANQREGPPKLLFTTAQYRFHAWRHGTGSVAAEQLTADVLPLPRLEPDYAVEVLTAKPCHGLVLLRRKYFRGYYLCNPCTGELSLLPDSEIPSKIMSGQQRRHINNSLVAYGLGYISKAKQHKVVRLISLHDEGTASCEVLPLDSVSVHWRPAAHQPAASCNSHHASVARPEAAVFFNGHLHFLQHHRQGQGVITTFDISDESFSSLSAPPGLENVPFGLAVLDGCLCAHYNGLSLSGGDDPFYISRLVRASGQWEQLCCIQRQAWRALLPPSKWVYPLEIYHDGGRNKKIMFATGVSTVFVVDLGRKAAAPEIVFSPAMLGCDVDDAIMESEPHHTVGLLEESLVSVGRTN
ncbi:F-box/kelch-repeat protein At3g23880-like [Aegilops tauschii subsp. strangulata]|uniref:F-box/kelch-repeat protein At3g23880-like n=1 Tax=Aegilops tauschii subsp. strangulata TaxID=200361 RepID=UPI000989FDFD|nr:F-box/kelch-repeat protein At3g23880-like [Aegilops tauschii subsp. strangulata]